MSLNKRKKASYLTDHTGYWMRLISNQVSYAFAQKLHSTNVTVAEWVILREMYEAQDAISPSEIAEITGLTRGAVSKLMARLLEKTLVSRKNEVDDKRYQAVQLTTKATTLVPKLASFADDNDQEFFSVLTAKERSHLNEILKKLATAHQITTFPIE